MITFDNLQWKPDRLILNNRTFRLQHYLNKEWELGNECFVFYKTKELSDEYKNFFSYHADFSTKNILELGMWDGGSIAYWNDILKPEKHVGIDIGERKDSNYFLSYIAENNLQNKISTHWGVNQADRNKLLTICSKEFKDPLDLIIDDASHLYDNSKASFEILFPLLRAGGLYIVEDWAWGHWDGFISPDHEWANQTALTQLIVDLVEVCGTDNSIISNISVYQGFTVIEKGSANISADFTIQKHVKKRSHYLLQKKDLVTKMKSIAKILLGRN